MTEDPYEWSDERLFDLLNVLEAQHEGELKYIHETHIADAVELGLLTPEPHEPTIAGKLLFAGYNAAKSVAETEKVLLFKEIERLKRAEGTQ